MELDVQELLDQISILNDAIKTQEYGLLWLNVPEAFETETENQIPVLSRFKELDISTDSHSEPNLLIEGDNYHALTCLNYTHHQKVDVIYIDPPYNTGSDGFRYKDKRVLDKFPDGSTVPKDHPLRHSYWLSFMYKRLVLAKQLLRYDGCILISINEEEFAQLKLLCDKVFGASNYLTMFTIKVRHEERILKGDKDFHEVVEYLLMYRASKEYKVVKKIYDNTSLEDYQYQIIEKNSNPAVIKMGKKEVAIFKPGEFEIIRIEPGAENFKKINIRGTLKEGNSSGRFYMTHLEARKKKGHLYRVPDMGNDKYDFRYFFTPDKASRVNGDYFQGVPLDIQDTKEVPYPNYFDFVEEFNNVGNEGGVTFGGGKKPISFLKHFLSIATQKKSAIVLDFFGGSGSTGHAVLDLNREDGGERSFILVTNNEEIVKDKEIQIMREICQPRLKNVSSEIPCKINFYTCDFIGSNNALFANDEDILQLSVSGCDLISIAENTLVLMELSDSYALYSNVGRTQFTAIYFVEELVDFSKFLTRVKKLRGEVTVYVFSWSAELEIDEFLEYKNISVKPFPLAIIGAYKTADDLLGGAK